MLKESNKDYRMKKHSYIIMLIILLLMGDLLTLPSEITLNSKISLIILAIFFIIFFIKDWINYKFKIYDGLNFLILLLMLIISAYFNDKVIIGLIILSLIIYTIDFKDIFFEYFISQIFIFLFYFFLCIIGILPLWSNGKFLVLGFNNKNIAGFILLNIFLFLILLNINSSFKNYIRDLILLLSFLVAWFFMKDRSVGILMMLTGIIFLILKQLKRINKLFKIIIISLPFILTFLSIFLAVNYGKYDWINKLDILLSSRIQIWHTYWNTFHLQLFPQNIDYYKYNFTIGESLLIKEAQDGFFALAPLQHGLIIFITIILLLSYTLKKIVDKFNKKQLLIFIILVLLCFTEYSPFIYYYSCFLFPYVFGEIGREHRYENLIDQNSNDINIQ